MGKQINVLFISNIVASISYSMQTPLFPDLASKFIEETYIGIIFSMYSLACLICIPFGNQLISKYGKVNLLYRMTVLNVICNFGSYLLYFINSKKAFIIFSVLIRFMLGISVGLLQLLGFALTSELSTAEEYTDNISYIEIATAFGLFLGPLFISIFVNLLGKNSPYMICIGFNFLCMYLFNTYFNTVSLNKTSSSINAEGILLREESDLENNTKPILAQKNSNKNVSLLNNLTNFNKNAINPTNKNSGLRKETLGSVLTKSNFTMNTVISRKSNKMIINSLHNSETNILKEIGSLSSMKHSSQSSTSHANASMFLKLITKLDILSPLLIVVFDMIAQSFFYPVFVDHFKKRFDMSLQTTSFLFSSSFIIYICGLKIVVRLIKSTAVKYILCVGVLVNSISVLFLAPAGFLPQSFISPVIGLYLLNFTAGFTVLGSILDFSDILENKFEFSENLADDTSSGIYIIGINIGELIGPGLGGALTSNFNFEYACMIIGFLNITASITYFIYNIKNIFAELIDTSSQSKKSLQIESDKAQGDYEEYSNKVSEN